MSTPCISSVDSLAKCNYYSVKNKRKKLEKLNEQHVNVNPEIESDSEETYKLIDDFVNMVEYTEKVSRKKFRNISDNNLDKIIEQIKIVKRNKESTLDLMFNGPKEKPSKQCKWTNIEIQCGSCFWYKSNQSSKTFSL